MTLRQLGGPIKGKPNRFLIIPGLADFEVGEEVYVFADDRKQPLFATLYGDLSLYRVARDENGVERVLNSLWQPVQFNGQSLRTLSSHYCRPRADNRRWCTVSVEQPKDQGGVEDAPKGAGGFTDLTPAAFDARIRALLPRSQRQPLPGQTISRSSATFESALIELRSRGLRQGGK